MFSYLLFSCWALCWSFVIATGPGTIVSPATGTKIAPGATFAFNYVTTQDYCKTSYGYSVYITTVRPTSFAQSQTFAQGTYLGFFNAPSSDNSNPFNAPSPPSNFTMPNFSQSLGGFGVGQSATNATVWLVVTELYQSCSSSFGQIFDLHYNQLTYNATTSTTTPPPTNNTNTTTTGFRIHPNGDTSTCVVTANGAVGNNNPVILQPCSSSSQAWSLNHGNTNITTGGTYSFDAGNTPGNGTPMKIYQFFPGIRAQSWYFTDDNRIAVTGSGLCLDLPNGNKTPGQRLQLWRCSTGNTNQVWTVTPFP